MNNKQMNSCRRDDFVGKAVSMTLKAHCTARVLVLHSHRLCETLLQVNMAGRSQK